MALPNKKTLRSTRGFLYLHNSSLRVKMRLRSRHYRANAKRPRAANAGFLYLHNDLICAIMRTGSENMALPYKKTPRAMRGFLHLHNIVVYVTIGTGNRTWHCQTKRPRAPTRGILLRFFKALLPSSCHCAALPTVRKQAPDHCRNQAGRNADKELW